jgi:hypothetical protein
MANYFYILIYLFRGIFMANIISKLLKLMEEVNPTEKCPKCDCNCEKGLGCKCFTENCDGCKPDCKKCGKTGNRLSQ